MFTRARILSQISGYFLVLFISIGLSPLRLHGSVYIYSGGQIDGFTFPASPTPVTANSGNFYFASQYNFDGTFATTDLVWWNRQLTVNQYGFAGTGTATAGPTSLVASTSGGSGAQFSLYYYGGFTPIDLTLGGNSLTTFASSVTGNVTYTMMLQDINFNSFTSPETSLIVGQNTSLFSQYISGANVDPTTITAILLNVFVNNNQGGPNDGSFILDHIEGFTVTEAVPEPSSVLLGAMGLGIPLVIGLKKKRKAAKKA